MTVEGIVRGILKQNGMQIKELAEECGMKPTTVRERICRSDRLVLDNLVELLDHMGCELIIRDKQRGCDYHIDKGRGRL